MRRQLSVFRFSSTGFPRKTRPRSVPGNHPSLRRLPARYTAKTNRDLLHRNYPHSFHGLRACYFSNVAEQTVDNNNDDLERNGTAHLLIEEDDPKRINYIQMLKAWYLEQHGEMIRDAFETKMIQNSNSKPDGDEDTVVDGTIRQLFTASFICPLTNERFEAGRLNGYYDIDSKNFYSRKKIALQAVSAVVLSHKSEAAAGETEDFADGFDATNYSKQHVNDQTHRQILQKLYMKNFKTSPTKSQSQILKQDFVGKTNGGTWWTSDFTCPVTNKTYVAADLKGVSSKMKLNEAGRFWYRKMSDSVHAAAFNVIESIDWDAPLDELEKTAKAPEEKEEWKELLQPLLFWYAQQGNQDMKISIENNFVVTEGFNEEHDNTLWTASFLCPLTGERFDSGTINATDAISSTERDNLIWYTERDTAILAASQRAYDILKYRETRVKDPRFCKEDPDDHSAVTSLETTITDQAKKDDENVEYDEDDYVIEVIPQQIVQASNSHSCSSGTLDIIARAWIDSTGAVPPQEGNIKGGMESFQNAFSEREKAISRALEWISKQDTKNSKLSGDRTQFDVQGEMGNLKIANAILSSLADCHQRIPFDSKPSGVEDCAVAILESMWSSQSTKPDAQSYALFLKCLEGATPADVAAKAQHIVDRMEDGHDDNQRALPKPNDAVYGSLFEIRALSGLDSILKNSDFNSHDRRMHLYKLSAMAHDPNTFDVEVAKSLIDQMKSLSERNDKPSLRPDVEIYNAPLRWSGGHLWSRAYSRIIPWDSYGEIYANGFKSDSEVDAHRNYAKKVEEWIEIMKTEALIDSTLAPTIETYESLIQAWVRCGNQESLLRAEAIAKCIMSGEYSDIEPRMQTIYPILAAWTYSGSEEGPQKVETWIDLLEESVPKLEPRLALPNVSIMAQTSLQRQILKHRCDALDEEKSRLFDSAKKCSQFLDTSIERYKDSLGSEIQSDVFMLVINTWYNAASSAMLQNNVVDTKKCFKEIQNTVDKYDDMLRWLHQVGEIKSDDSESTELRAPFLRLLNRAPSVYGAQLEAVNAMERNLDAKDYDRTMHLISIEEKIRRLEEFHLFWEDGGCNFDDSMLKGNTDSNAMSLFPVEDFMGDLFCRSWSHYIHSCLDALEKGANDSLTGQADFLRLALLIANVSSSVTPAVLDSVEKGHTVEKIANILETSFGNVHDRKTVISTVFQSLNKYSFAPGSNEVRSRSSGAPHYDAINKIPKEDGQESGSVDANAKRKARRERVNRRSDIRRSSYSRSKVSSRSLRTRRPRPRHAEQNGS